MRGQKLCQSNKKVSVKKNMYWRVIATIWKSSNLVSVIIPMVWMWGNDKYITHWWVKIQFHIFMWIKGLRWFVLCDFRRLQWSCPHRDAEGSADSPAAICGLPRVPGCVWPQLEGVRDDREGLTGAWAGGGRPAGWREPSPSHLLTENYTWISSDMHINIFFLFVFCR